MIENLIWLAMCIYFEAAGEPKAGQIAVGHVILNRVEKSGNSIKDVVTKPRQFSWLNEGRPPIKDYKSFIKCVDSAIECLRQRLDGKDLWGADHYFNPNKSNPTWQKSMEIIVTIGNHKFLKS
jgi:N-acetylmuramoyl-L-alanine amidase